MTASEAARVLAERGHISATCRARINNRITKERAMSSWNGAFDEPAMANELDYPVAPPENVHPVIYRAQIIQTMGLEYFKAMTFGSDEDFTLDNGMEAAKATWNTEWESDPEPRTLELGIAAAHSDLEHWVDD